MLGIILGVKNDAEFENDICRRVSQRLGAVYSDYGKGYTLFCFDLTSDPSAH